MTTDEAIQDLLYNVPCDESIEMAIDALRFQKRKETIDKIIGMFTPRKGRFLMFNEEDVICGPDDRALVGFSTNFPICWLVDDYGFTEEEAKWFVRKVHEIHHLQFVKALDNQS